MHRNASRRTALLTLALALCTAPGAAQGGGAPPPAAPPMPEVTVSLVTMGSGDLVWEKFGHNALWVHDPVRGTDHVYNYGVFDFNSPGYWGRFVRGDWLYQLAVDDIQRTVWAYRYMNRSLTVQELNLTPEQKGELVSFLEWNYRPENREYRYDYYRDNCSTRLRDVLDRVLDGRLRAATERVETGTTYRWHSRRLLARDPAYYAGLQAGLGPAADRPISAWEEMFLPQKLHDRVATLQVAGPDGRPQPLVRSEQVVYEAPGRPADPTAPPRAVPWFLLVGAVLAALVAGTGAAAARSRAARFAFAAVSALWALLVGTGGLLLLGLWAATNHTIAYRNENLLQLDPLLLPLALLLPALAYGARWAAPPARAVAYAVAALSVLGLVVQPIPGLDQVNGELIALALPVNLALAWAARRLGERAAPPPADRARGGREQPAAVS